MKVAIPMEFLLLDQSKVFRYSMLFAEPPKPMAPARVPKFANKKSFNTAPATNVPKNKAYCTHLSSFTLKFKMK